MPKVRLDLLLEIENIGNKYLKSCVVSPIELETRLISETTCYDTFNERMVIYSKYYFDGSTIVEELEECSTLKPDDFSKFDYGICGYLIEKKLSGLLNKDDKQFYFLNLTNGDFVRFKDNEFNISKLTNSISDIGKPARAGLLDDFISFVIGYENLELGDKALLSVKHIYDICEKWFPKHVDDLCELVEKMTSQDKDAKKIETLIQDQNDQMNQNELEPTKLSSLVVESIFIPSKKFEDMFKPDSVENDLFIVDEYQGSTKNTRARMWFSNVYDESIGLEMDALFLTIGKKLYVFDYIEEISWVRDLDSEVEGFEQIHSNKLGCSNLINHFLNIYAEVAEESVKAGRIKKEDKWLISDDLNLQILPLLFIACTNTEIANENLTVPEFVGVFKELTGIDILNNPDLYRLKNHLIGNLTC